MTSRSIYEHGIDFAALAMQYPSFNKHLKNNGQLDFSNPETVQVLTKSLLHRDFGIQIDLPGDRLCPPVPNRLHYILWLQGLVDSTSNDFKDKYDAKRDVIGLDIGTGASCIYPLLGCAQRPNWKFAATDIDPKSLDYAKNNIIRNDLQTRIRPFLTQPSQALLPLDHLKLESIDFSMCNPPFYSSAADLLASAAAKKRPPRSSCTGADVEMVTQGGEVAFVTRMIDQSKDLQERCQWFTSMLGKASSVEQIIEKIKAAGVTNFAVTDLMPGSATKRWVVGWSWASYRPSEAVARASSTLPKHLLPFPTEYKLVPWAATIDTSAHALNGLMQELDMQWWYKPELSDGVGFAKANVWSRAARRKREQANKAGADDFEEEEPEEPALAVKISIRLPRRGGITATVRWLQGRDSVLFESFCGMLKRQLSEGYQK